LGHLVVPGLGKERRNRVLKKKPDFKEWRI
jgi:hypothetical protein